MPLTGLLASVEQVISLLSMVLLLFPSVPLVALIKIIPEVVAVSEPFTRQYFTVLFVASFIKRMVAVVGAPEILVFEITRSLIEPLAFTRPSIVTLSAPSKSISGVGIFPIMLSPVEVGYMFTAE